MKLKNKTILITGGSQGIGFAIAEQCAQEGARLILISRHKKDLMQAINKLSTLSKSTHTYHALDVSDASQVKKLALKLKKEKLALHGLVNCAAIQGPIGKSRDIEARSFERTVAINLLGTINTCLYISPLFARSTRGKIVNLSGGGATSPFPNYSTYAVSKVGVVRFTENIALEYPKLDANTVAPGFVVTRMHDETIRAGRKRAGEEYLERTKMEIQKGGTSPHKASELTVFLLSKASDGITGKLISAPWDPWDTLAFQKKLKAERNFGTLRRIDDKFYYQK